MYSSVIHSYGTPRLNIPVFIQGITRTRQKRSVSELLIDHVNATKFADLYSPYFPDFLTAGAEGIGWLPHYEFFMSTQYDPHLVILVGDSQFLPRAAYANYEVSTTIINFIKKLGCKQIITYGFFSPTQVEDTIYVTTTSETLATKITQIVGGRVLSEGRLSVSLGGILGFAQQCELLGICILKPIIGRRPPEVAVLSIFKYILALLQSKRCDIDVDP